MIVTLADVVRAWYLAQTARRGGVSEFQRVTHASKATLSQFAKGEIGRSLDFDHIDLWAEHGGKSVVDILADLMAFAAPLVKAQMESEARARPRAGIELRTAADREADLAVAQAQRGSSGTGALRDAPPTRVDTLSRRRKQHR